MIKILKYGDVPKSEIFKRFEVKSDVSGIVGEILENVKKNGDRALIEYTKKFDGVELDSLLVSDQETEEALAGADERFLEILTKAKENIELFHKKQKREGFVTINNDGATVGQRITPVDRAGLYVPGGTAAYPSTVLMDLIPAKIAGVKEIVMVSPPGRDGKINPSILCAAHVAGADRIFKAGGAQAIAALAFGTETIPKVDKIVGPGNQFVAEAKKQVFGKVSIDMIAGPSEILIVSDGKSDPKVVAADLLSQAEHDKNASAVLVTNSEDLAKNVSEELEKQIPDLERHEIARASIDTNGKIIIADDLDIVIEIANEIAPEHLELCIDEPLRYLDKIRHAGSIFLGRNTPEAFGDYYAGPNHTLPTSGTARFSSALSVDDFIKKTQYIYYPDESMKKIAEDVKYFADMEGLTAHGKSAVIRLKEE